MRTGLNKWFSTKSGIGPLYNEAGVVCDRERAIEILFDAMTSGSRVISAEKIKAAEFYTLTGRC